MAFRPLALHPDRDMWEQQPGETGHHFSRFCAYRDMSPDQRTYRKVAEHTGRKINTIEQQASAHKWRERAAAHDAEQSRQHRERIAVKAERLSNRQMDVALGMVQAAANAVHYVLSNQIVLEPGDASRWVDIATKIGKVAADQPDKVVAVTGADGGPVEVSEFDGLSPEQKRHRAQEMAEGVLRLYEGGKSA